MYLTEPAESETSSGNGVANHTYIGSSDHVILKDMDGHDDVKIVNGAQNKSHNAEEEESDSKNPKRGWVPVVN